MAYLKSTLCFQLTTEVKQVCEEEGMLVEVLYGHHYGSIKAAAKSFFRSTLVSY